MTKAEDLGCVLLSLYIHMLTNVIWSDRHSDKLSEQKFIRKRDLDNTRKKKGI